MLFVYGTLQDADVLGAVLGRTVAVTTLRPATAPGYRAVAYPGRVYPALVPSPGDAAPGLLVEGLSALDIAVLDAFEGEEYSRLPIAVMFENTSVPAETYRPVAVVSAAAPHWSLADWTERHKPSVIGQETGTAMAMRQRLSARQPG